MFETIHDWMQWLGGNTALYLLPFLAVIGVLVFVHEWGHYIVARMCGVKVETFSIGFGKKIWSRTDKGGTQWQIALIPLGGYVKMFGDTDPASAVHTDKVTDETGLVRPMSTDERQQAFFAKPVWKRAAIVFAGPAINFLFAIIILSSLFMTIGRPVTPPIAAAVIVGSAAQEAGIQPHDRILTMDGKKVRRFADIQRHVAISLDKPVAVEVERDGKTITLPAITPKMDSVQDRFGFRHSRGLLGIIGPGMGLSVDGIEAVDGKSGNIAGQLKSHMGRNATLRMKAVGADAPEQNIIVRLTPELNKDFMAGSGEGAKGLLLAPRLENEVIAYGPVGAVVEALNETWFVSVGTLQSLGQMIIGTRSAQELGGIIRIGAVTGDAAQAGFVALLTLGALLSINLGLINLLPIPMLDGGHLLFYAIEAIKGKPIPEKVQDAALRFGFVVLIALMVFANLNDVIQLSR